MYKIGVACDHGGYDTKEIIVKFLKSENYTVIDYGTDSTESVDYPDYGHLLAKAVESKECDFGVALCSSGTGINMTVNKHQGIRAAICWNRDIAELARQHNDANICGLPAKFISADYAIMIVKKFLETGFDGGRHKRRIEKIPYC